MARSEHWCHYCNHQWTEDSIKSIAIVCPKCRSKKTITTSNHIECDCGKDFMLLKNTNTTCFSCGIIYSPKGIKIKEGEK